MMHDALVVCDEEREDAARPGTGIIPTYLKAGMTVMDLTSGTAKSELLREAELRGCLVVQPLDLLVSLLEQQAHTLAGKPVPRKALIAAIPPRFKEE